MGGPYKHAMVPQRPRWPKVRSKDVNKQPGAVRTVIPGSNMSLCELIKK